MQERGMYRIEPIREASEIENKLDKFELVVKTGDTASMLKWVRSGQLDEGPAQDRWVWNKQEFKGSFSETLFVKKKRLIQAGTALEDLLIAKDETKERLVQEYLIKFREMSEHVKKGLMRLNNIYRSREQDAINVETKLQELYKTEKIGDRLFLMLTEQEPTDAVDVERREGFIVLVFRSHADYKLFVQVAQKKPVSEYLDSGGVYFNEGISTIGLTVPTILIQAEAHGDFHIRKVVDHERQHFINRALNLIRLGESGARTSKAARIPENNQAWDVLSKRGFSEFKDWLYNETMPELFDVKDELLAYLREGRKPQNIFDTLSENKLYEHLWFHLSEQRIQQAKNILQRTVSLLEKILEMSIFSHTRELVYFLVDVPLPHMPYFLEQAIEQWKTCQKKTDRKNQRAMERWQKNMTPVDPYEVYEALPKVASMSRHRTSRESKR